MDLHQSDVLLVLIQFFQCLPQFGCVLVKTWNHNWCLIFQQFLLQPGHFLIHTDYLLLLVKLKQYYVHWEIWQEIPFPEILRLTLSSGHVTAASLKKYTAFIVQLWMMKGQGYVWKCHYLHNSIKTLKSESIYLCIVYFCIQIHSACSHETIVTCPTLHKGQWCELDCVLLYTNSFCL